jgi:hypothetical protein
MGALGGFGGALVGGGLGGTGAGAGLMAAAGGGGFGVMGGLGALAAAHPYVAIAVGVIALFVAQVVAAVAILNSMSSHYRQYNFQVNSAALVTQQAEFRKDIAWGQAWSPMLSAWERLKTSFFNLLTRLAPVIEKLAIVVGAMLDTLTGIVDWLQGGPPAWMSAGSILHGGFKALNRFGGAAGVGGRMLPAQAGFSASMLSSEVNNSFVINIQHEEEVQRAIETIRAALDGSIRRHDLHLNVLFGEMRGRQLAGALL